MNQLFSSMVTTLAPKVLGEAAEEYIPRFLTIVREAIVDSRTPIDDVLFLPVIEAIDKILDKR